jgi:hypothetical protein
MRRTRPTRTLWLAFLLPPVIGGLFWVLDSILWRSCFSRDNPVESDGVFFGLLALVTLSFFIYGWYRGQKPQILAAQAALVAVLTAVSCLFGALVLAGTHECLS